MSDELDRTKVVTEIINGLKITYPNAKRMKIDIRFEWQECDDCVAELCPVVLVEVEN